jgi:GNAT superfamily N-acetyltransferase
MTPYYSIYESKDIYSNLKKEYNNKNIDISMYSKNDKVYVISLIRVPKELRNTGIGKSVMKDIINIADINGITLCLTPTNEFGSSKNRLINFYKSFGFVDNKGKNKDYSISETMIRIPK